MTIEKTVADFFAGIGLVTLGFERSGWNTIYAVDYSSEKLALYTAQFGSVHYHLQDVHEVHGQDVPRVALAHASFPCTDLSVAGSRGGIREGESSAFWEFVRILEEMKAENRLPPILMLENVEGLLTSQGGKDLVAVLESLTRLDYSVDMFLINASHFVPQSRVRLFVIGAQVAPLTTRLELETQLVRSGNARPEKIKEFIRAHANLRWSLRSIPHLPSRSIDLSDIIDQDADWWEEDRRDYLFNQMFDRHKKMLHQLVDDDRWTYATVFRRMRMRDGEKRSTAEVRIDGVAGCLRTPKGGSARQIVVRVGKGKFDARLLNAKENARLMGADDFNLPDNISLNDALFGFGDAVCVPVVEWIAVNYLDPLFVENAPRWGTMRINGTH